MEALEKVHGRWYQDPSKLVWRLVHSFCFALGGFTFIAGTACYFDSFQAYYLGAWLYIIGSFGFLGVDVLELATYYKVDKYLAINICLSVIGSSLYILGSIGFLPWLNTVDGSTSALGIWGFILGSFFIGSSQIWKVLRIGGGSASDREAPYKDSILKETWNFLSAFKWSNIFRNKDKTSSFGVEFNACLGGWCFFFGTIMYNIGTLSGNYFLLILIIWTCGAVFFSLGALFLAWRHFRLKPALMLPFATTIS